MNTAIPHNIVLFLSGEDKWDESLLQYANDGLFLQGNHLHLVHIVNEHSLKQLPSGVNVRDQDQVKAVFDKKFSQFQRQLSETSQRKLKFSCHLLFHKEAKLKALEFLKEVKADACVLATRGEQGVEGIFAESFSYYLVAHAPCDVLVIRPNKAKA